MVLAHGRGCGQHLATDNTCDTSRGRHNACACVRLCVSRQCWQAASASACLDALGHVRVAGAVVKHQPPHKAGVLVQLVAHVHDLNLCVCVCVCVFIPCALAYGWRGAWRVFLRTTCAPVVATHACSSSSSDVPMLPAVVVAQAGGWCSCRCCRCAPCTGPVAGQAAGSSALRQ